MKPETAVLQVRERREKKRERSLKDLIQTPFVENKKQETSLEEGKSVEVWIEKEGMGVL